MDYLFNFLIQDYQQVALLAIVLYLIIKITITLDRFYMKTKRLHDTVPGMERLLMKIDTGLTLLNKTLLNKSIINESCYSSDHSPRAVNILGEKLFKESGADALFASQKKMLLNELALKPIDSLLQLQTEALNVLLAHWDDPAFRPLQNFVYQHPTYDRTPLSYPDLLFVISLKLRDYYISKHPELTAK